MTDLNRIRELYRDGASLGDLMRDYGPDQVERALGAKTIEDQIAIPDDEVDIDG